MPFVAIYNQAKICSLDIPYNQWVTLKKDGATFKCLDCGEQMHPKTINRTGTQFFAHNKLSPNCSFSQGESDAHIIAKAQIYNTLKQVATKYNLTHIGVEQYGESFRTDVWAETNDTIYLFEIQISNIPYNALIERSLNFYNFKTDKKIIPIWIFKRIPDINKNDRIPSKIYNLRKLEFSVFCESRCRICHNQHGLTYNTKYREICNPKRLDFINFKECIINKYCAGKEHNNIKRDYDLNALRYTPPDELIYFKKCGIIIDHISNKEFINDCYNNPLKVSKLEIISYINHILSGNQERLLQQQDHTLNNIDLYFKEIDTSLKTFINLVYKEIHSTINEIKEREENESKKQQIKYKGETDQQKLFVAGFGHTAHRFVELNTLFSRKYDPDQAISDFWQEFYSEHNFDKRIKLVLEKVFDVSIHGNPTLVYVGNILVYKRPGGVVNA